jgi:hypothetical protein
VIPYRVEGGRRPVQEASCLGLCRRKVLLVQRGPDVGGDAAGEGWLQRAAPGAIVAAGQEVERPPHGRHPDDGAGVHGLEEAGAVEVAQAAPEADDGRARQLGLEAGQVFEGRLRPAHLARQQPLPRQQGAIQLTTGEAPHLCTRAPVSIASFPKTTP